MGLSLNIHSYGAVLTGVIVGAPETSATAMEVVESVGTEEPVDVAAEVGDESSVAEEDVPVGVAPGSKTSTPRLWTPAVEEADEVVTGVKEAFPEAVGVTEEEAALSVVETSDADEGVADAGENVTVVEARSELISSTSVVEAVEVEDTDENVIVVEVEFKLLLVLVALTKLEVDVAEGTDEEDEPAKRSSEAACGESSGVMGVNISVTFCALA